MPRKLICPVCEGDRTVRLFDATDNVKVLHIGQATLVSIPEHRQGRVVVCPHCHGRGAVEGDRVYLPNSDLGLHGQHSR